MQEEKIIETKTCKHCEVKFEITDKDLEFYEKVSPVFAGKKYKISTPTLCPDCRQQRRLSFRNERKLYKRKCDATGRSIISIYSPDKPYKVYDQEIWWSDKWDPMDYGKDFDFNRSFFEQFEELMREVPMCNLYRDNCENCSYGSYLTNCKGCYLCFNGSNNNDCLYCNNITNCNNLIDSSYIQDSNRCYSCSYLSNCSDSIYSFNCEFSNCIYFCINCIKCEECILSSNLVGKKFFINNKEYAEKEYFILKNKLLGSINNFNQDYSNLFNSTIFSNLIQKGSENFTGDIIFNSKDIKYSFEIYSCNNVSYSQRLLFSDNCMDITFFGLNSTYGYELHNCGSNFYKNIFSSFCYRENQNISYCMNTYTSSNLFGCVGVKNKSYCILNKQYTKEEYEKLVPKIIGHMQKTGEWGEFFPSSISPFGYNETVAMEYFPLDRRDVLSKHLYKWSDYESPFPKVEKIIPADKLPENIADIPDDILNWAIECEVTKKPFRIIKQELDFYRKHNLPLPKRHPDQRHLDRMKLRNPRKLFDRKCDKCGKDMKTTYAPDRKEIVYCEECYNKEVY